MKDYKLEQDVVSFQQAIDLCTLGFDEPTLCAYDIDDQQLYLCQLDEEGLYMPQKDIYAPTHSQVFRWLREKHNIVAPIYSNASGYLYEWHDALGGTQRGWSEFEGPNDGGVWDTYEEAENACIDKLIELAKQQEK